MDTTFTTERLLRIVLAAVVVGGLVQLTRFICHRLFGISISRNEAVLFSSAVMFFLLITNAIGNLFTTITYAAVLIAAYFVSKLATRLIK